MDKLMIVGEVAEILRVDKQRVYDLARTNKIPAIRVGKRQYRFSEKAIENFLESGGTQKDDGREDSE